MEGGQQPATNNPSLIIGGTQRLNSQDPGSAARSDGGAPGGHTGESLAEMKKRRKE
jgi:hypothetical protein